MSADLSPASIAPAPPRSRARFWTRHRAPLLLAAFVLYTAALALCVADELLGLGLFPTQMERTARSLIAQLDDPDEHVRASAVRRLVGRWEDFVAVAGKRPGHEPWPQEAEFGEVESFVAVPELIRALDSASAQRRALANDCLRRITRTDVGYDPEAPPAERRPAIARWRAWWKENQRYY